MGMRARASVRPAGRSGWASSREAIRTTAVRRETRQEGSFTMFTTSWVVATRATALARRDRVAAHPRASATVPSGSHLPASPRHLLLSSGRECRSAACGRSALSYADHAAPARTGGSASRATVAARAPPTSTAPLLERLPSFTADAARRQLRRILAAARHLTIMRATPLAAEQSSCRRLECLHPDQLAPSCRPGSRALPEARCAASPAAPRRARFARVFANHVLFV